MCTQNILKNNIFYTLISIRVSPGNFEYTLNDLSPIFCKVSNLFSISYYCFVSLVLWVPFTFLFDLSEYDSYMSQIFYISLVTVSGFIKLFTWHNNTLKIPGSFLCTAFLIGGFFKFFLQHRRFLVDTEKFLKTAILKNICERLLVLYIGKAETVERLFITKFW